VFCDKRILDLEVPAADIDFEADLSGIIQQYTSYYAATDEMHDGDDYAKQVEEGNRLSARCIEVGHIFYFGEKYSKPMNATVAGPDGKDVAVHMGSYGVGVSRLMGALIEAHHDDDGCKWPMSVAPFHVGLVNLKPGDDATDATCRDIEASLTKAGVEVLYDDTKARPGEKFARMDLIGLPLQITVGPRGLSEGKVEAKRRSDGERFDAAPGDIADRVIAEVRAALAE
ncbi:MAG: His/Gly/Thr/Pro-type tRNA ligase C-terminal domain-containing protein, partial [Pseudomonadota bacterium]